MWLNTLSFPLELRLGSTQVPFHFLFEALGIFIGFRYFLWLKRTQGDPIASPHRVWILIGATFGAALGSRMLGALENPALLQDATEPWWYAFQQKTIVGGLLGGLFGVELTKFFLGEKQRSGDLFVYPLLLAMIIGRIGCFSMGVYEETYGLPSQLPWALNLGDGINRHPVTLYEMAFLIALWTGLRYWQKRHPLQEGSLFRYFMVAYFCFRLGLDFIKPHTGVVLGLSSIQLACLMGLLWYSPHLGRKSALPPNSD